MALVAAGLLAAVAAPAFAQDGEQPDIRKEGNYVILKPHPGGKGWPIRDLFDAIAQATGRSILFESGTQIVKNKTVEWTGPHRIQEGELFYWLQAVLSYHGLVLVPVGPPGASGQQQWFALDSANANLTSHPLYLAENEILKYAERDGLYVVTTFTLKHIKDVGRVRQALSQLSTKTAGLGRMNDIPGHRAVIVGDFAPIVAAMKRLLDFIDVPNVNIEPRMEVVQLYHAVASELEPIISELIEQSVVAGQPPRNRNQTTPQQEPEPKIIADPRLDALIIYAVDSHMRRIKELIHTLDVPNANRRQRIHFRPLKHTDADEMAATISDLIERTGVVGGGTRSTSGSRRNTTNRNRPNTSNQGAQQSAFGGGVGEGDAVIIADNRSNSLIIHASPTQYDSIDQLITRLDQSRPQVLIETALVELAIDDSLALGVELFASNNDIGVDTDGDGVADSLTSERKLFGASTFGLSTPTEEVINGVTVPGRSPILGTGFTAGIFKDGRLPVLLTALQSSGRAKILTMPSVVTNDNKEATLTFERTTSFRQSIRDDTGDRRDSFDTVTATTNLTISPTIASDNYLRLVITQSVQNFGTRPAPDAPPDQVSRDISTNVTLPDRYTVVLGGLVQEEERSSVSKVPILGDIPIFGFLFRSSSDSSSPSHLFLFVTPRILRDTERFEDYVRLTWEKKLLSEDLFGSELGIIGGNFVDPSRISAAERARIIERSGALDAARLKAPVTEQERIRAARDAARAAGRGAELPTPTNDR